jgi:hypothetical protein
MFNLSNLVLKHLDPLSDPEYALATDDPGRNLVLETYGGLMRRVRAVCPGVYLTGGAVRDTYFGRPVKDLDFISQNGQDAHDLTEAIGQTLRPCIDPEMLALYAPHSGSMLLAYETLDKSINLLYVFDVWGRINEFPDSISRCWTDGEEVYGTAEFKRTALDSCVRTRGNISAEREKRLRDKYPTFSFEFGSL